MDGLTPETLAARQDSTIFLLMLVKILMKLLLLLCTCYNGQTSIAFWLIIARNSEPLPLAKRDETLPCALFLFIGKCMEMIV